MGSPALSASALLRAPEPAGLGAGSPIGRLRRYCNGTRFRVRLVGRRKRTAVIVVALRGGEQVHEVVRRR